jgi:hypothetical protein
MSKRSKSHFANPHYGHLEDRKNSKWVKLMIAWLEGMEARNSEDRLERKS